MPERGSHDQWYLSTLEPPAVLESVQQIGGSALIAQSSFMIVNGRYVSFIRYLPFGLRVSIRRRAPLFL
jgi:hypothetical protein